MFYAHFVLAKKGPLARIWLAAHWDKKLTKAHVFETNIEKSVDGILQPKVKMALRTSGHLLLGVVRIYSRKAKYLLADCNEAFVKIKMAFRPGMVDLPEENREAAVNAITLPEVFHDFDTAMPDLNDVDIEAQFTTLNRSRVEQITMNEDYGNVPFATTDDGFGELSFDPDAPEINKPPEFEPSIDHTPVLYGEPMTVGIDAPSDREPMPSTSAVSDVPEAMDVDQPVENDFNETDVDLAGGLFEGGLFVDAAAIGDSHPSIDANTISEPIAPVSQDSDDDMGDFGGPPSVGGHSTDESRPASAVPPTADAVSKETAPLVPPPTVTSEEALSEPPEPIEPPQSIAPNEQTTLLQNEEESFALAPVDASALKGFTKAKRKRKLIVDEVKNISGEEMKNQLSDTSDIVTTLDLAPPTKRLMHWKETGGVEKLFALPARSIPARILFKNYQRHLTTRAFGTEDFPALGDPGDLQIDKKDNQQQGTELFKRQTRKRKYPSGETSENPMHALSAEASQIDSIQQPPTPQTSQQNNDVQISLTEIQNDPSVPPRPASDESPALEASSVPPAALAMPLTSPATPLGPPETPMMAPATPLGAPATPLMQHSMVPTPQTAVQNDDLDDPGSVMPPPATPSSFLQPQTPGVATPMDVDIPHLQADQVHSLLEGDNDHRMEPPMTPDEDRMLSHGLEMPQTPGQPQQLNESLQLQLQQQQQQQTLLHHQLPHQQPEQHRLQLNEHSTQQLQDRQDHGHQLDAMSTMANMGYDQMANMGYDEHLPTTTPAGAASERVGTPWHEDYDFPPSAGPLEEQQTDETIEEFEERVLNKRAAQMFTAVKKKLVLHDQLFLSEMTIRNNRKQAAQKFYSLLVLKKFQVLELAQEGPYEDILVTKGPKFDNPAM